tara:strand:+ start:88 stop:228 length:141 start_codon:yes stop_codon:yes gene_type:complete
VVAYPVSAVSRDGVDGAPHATHDMFSDMDHMDIVAQNAVMGFIEFC